MESVLILAWNERSLCRGISAHFAVEYAPELRRFTNRLFNKIEGLGGFVFYVGVRKTAAPGEHNPNRLYARVFLEAIKRIDGYCAEDCDPPGEFVLILDEHEQRSALLSEAAKSMYGRRQRRRHLIEPPFHLESHRYQTIQAADWIAGLGGVARERGVPAVFRAAAASREPPERNPELRSSRTRSVSGGFRKALGKSRVIRVKVRR